MAPSNPSGSPSIQPNILQDQGVWGAQRPQPPDSCAPLSLLREGSHPRGWGRFCFVLILLAILALVAGCGRSRQATRPSEAEREQQAIAIATEYAQTGDLAQAEARLYALGLSRPDQWLAVLAERYMRDGQDPVTTERLVSLAMALGVKTIAMVEYARVHFSPTPAPTSTATPTETPTPVLATPTPVETPTPAAPPSPTPTATPSSAPTTAPTPYIVVQVESLNVRAGPGTAYPIVGRLAAEDTLAIVGRNETGDWWQVCCLEGQTGWVAASLVEARAATGVPVITDVPAPPPTVPPAPTAVPEAAAPTPPPPAAPPGVAYVVKSVRLKSVGEDAQSCTGGDHNILVIVEDAAGNPLDGVRVREIFSNRILVTGTQGKGPGRVEYDIYRGGGGQIEIVDEANNRISELSRGMSDDWPPFDLMKAAGYCNCKPHPDDASCEADLANKTYLFAVGHYAYVVVFQRTW